MTQLRVLALAPFPPRLDATHGGGRAIAGLLAGLAQRHRVALLALRGPGEPSVDDALRACCDLVHETERPDRRAGGWSGDLRVALALAGGTPMWVSRWSVPRLRQSVAAVAADWRPDIVQAEYHLMAQYFAALPPGIPHVLRQHEPGAATAHERARGRRGLARGLAAAERWAWHRYEAQAMRAADAVAVLTPHDRERLVPLAGGREPMVIPLGVPIPERAADPGGRCPSTVLFVGNFIHPPNQDAAERLVHRIFPLVRGAVPAAELRVVGPEPSPSLRLSSAPGVTITGEVTSVGEHLEDAAIVAAPLQLGGGMRVKVAEALAAGKAVVATPLAVEGLDVRDGRELRLAESDEAFAEAVVDLLRDPAARIALGGRARAWAVSSLGWAGPVAAFERLYESLLRDRRP